MVDHNANEGLLFTNPTITNLTALEDFLNTFLPDISLNIVNYINTVLYPAIFNGSYGYTS